MLKTIQITLPDTLLERVDRTATELDISRSAFAREALELALKQHEIAEQERLDTLGYQRTPSQPDEFAPWQDVQDWGAR